MKLKQELLLLWIIITATLFSSYAQNTAYPWLDELIDTEDCCFNQKVDVYDYHGVHKFIFIANDENCSSFSEGYTGSLHYQDGTLWCNNRPDLDCRTYYKISYESTIYECDGQQAELTNEQKARAVIEGLATGDQTAFTYVSDEQYIQHNLAFPTGKEIIAPFFTGQPTGITIDIHRSFEVGNFVILHTTYGGAWQQIAGSGSDQVAFDVFRFEDGLIVEHWDNLANVADDMDGTTQTDGALTPATDLESTDANQALLEEMAQTLFVNGDWTNLRDYFDLDTYIQHSVGAGADGAFLATLEGATGTPFYDEVKFVYTQGNFGLVMSQGPDIYGVDLEGTYAYYDLFRMENGKIVEHWDVIQLIPPQDQWANDNGKWGDDKIINPGAAGDNVVVYNSFEDATLTGGQQGFFGAGGPEVVADDAVEFPGFIGFYDIDVNNCGLTMTLIDNSGASDLLLPDGRFDRYYFGFDSANMPDVSVSGGSAGLTVNASVTPLPAGYTVPVEDLFGTGYALPITLPNGGFMLQLGGGTDLTELGQTISVDFGCPATGLSNITTDTENFFPEDITIANDVAYVSSFADGTIYSFDLTETDPQAEVFAAGEEGYTQAWGLKSDGEILLSLLNNADFTGNPPGPAKLVQYDIARGSKTAEWDLPANVVGHTVSIVDGKYYVTNFGFPQIFEVDPVAGTVKEWFTSDEWDASISGLGGTIYDNEGGFYISQGNKLWYLPISGGEPGTLQEVDISGLDIIDADGITWVENQNTLYYATNDTGDPANVGTAYKLVFSDKTTATGSVVASGLDDTSGVWYLENDGSEYLFILESQFGALFGINEFDPPFNIEIIKLN